MKLHAAHTYTLPREPPVSVQIIKSWEVFVLILTTRKMLKKLEINSSYIRQRIEVTGPPAALKSRDTGGRHRGRGQSHYR